MTPLVSASTLSRARSILARLHETTAALSRMTETVSASGSVSRSWSSVGNIQCRVETDMGREKQARVIGEDPADRPVSEYVVYAAHDADIRPGDRLTLASGFVFSVMRASRGQSQGFASAFHCTEAAS